MSLLVLGQSHGCQCSESNDTKPQEGEHEAGFDAGPGSSLRWLPLPDGINCGPGCRQLTHTGSVIEYDVWGGRVVASETTGERGLHLTLVDVSRNRWSVLDIGYTTTDLFVMHPTVSNRNIYYSGKQSGEFYLVRGDEMGKHRTPLAPDRGARYTLDSSAGKLAYVVGRDRDVLVLDLKSMKSTVITEGAHAVQPTISGKWVTYTKVAGNTEIFGYNVETKEHLNLSDHPAAQFNSRNDGPRVVWTDLRNSPEGKYGSKYNDADIYYYNIETKELKQITKGNGIQLYPDINGDWIVWTDFRECPDPNNPYSLGCQYVWGYNLATDEERKLSHVSGDNVRVWGDNVFFVYPWQAKPHRAGVFVQDIGRIPERGID